jgi:hypothetical protein
MSITGQDIIDEARAKSDLRKSQYYRDDPHLIGFANDAFRELYKIFVASKEGYFFSTTTLALTNNAATLPADFYKELLLSCGAAPNEQEIFRLKSYSRRLCDHGFWIANNTLTIYPTNVAVPFQPVTFDYVPTCPAITQTTTIPAVFEAHNEFLVEHVTIKIMQGRRQEEAAVPHVARLAELTIEAKQTSKGRTSGPHVPAIPVREQNRYRRNTWNPYRYGNY